MSGPLRSKNGCWTCRLRKKKCDEGHPKCVLCTSLDITCYGYGPAPDWMGDGEKEKAIAKSLKEVVKHTSRRKTTVQVSKKHEKVLKMAAKGSSDSMERSSINSGTSSQPGITPPSDHGPSQGNGVIVSEDQPTEPFIPVNGGFQATVSKPSISADESVLLMNFLDTVFPLQHPMYQPKIQDGGRGWLLTRLIQSEPFYHAALATSAYHRRTTALANASHSFQIAALVEQEQHFEICIKLVTEFAQSNCPNNALGMISSVVQLIFFELYTCHTNSWQAHLRAAMKMFERSSEQNFARFGLAEKSRKIAAEDQPFLENEPIVMQEILNLRFLRGTIIWLDIAFSITSGASPSLLSYHPSVLSSTSQTQLGDIMGCKNGMIFQIARIAILQEQKTQALQQGKFSCAEFGQTVLDIRKEIHNCLREITLEGLTISAGNSAPMNTIPGSYRHITHTFAYMSLVYLHLVFYGFQNLGDLESIISEAIQNLQTKVSTHLLPALVLPLFFLGSVAREGDKEYFRHIFSSPPLLDTVTKYRANFLLVLEEIWKKNRTEADFTWKDCLELTKDLLFI